VLVSPFPGVPSAETHLHQRVVVTLPATTWGRIRLMVVRLSVKLTVAPRR